MADNRTTSPPPAASVPPVAPALLKAGGDETPAKIPPVQDKLVFWVTADEFLTGGKYKGRRLRLGGKILMAAGIANAAEFRVTCRPGTPDNPGSITIEAEENS